MNPSNLKIIHQDIAVTPSDVMVNSANPWLGGIGRDLTQMCGGVDGAIHRAAGIGLLDECETLPTFERILNGETVRMRCDHGDFRVTQGYNLPCQKVYHAVAPRYRDGKSGELEMLAELYRRLFTAFVATNFQTIALPPMGTRSFGMPKAESARIAVRTAIEFLAQRTITICFCVIDDEEYELYQKFASRRLAGKVAGGGARRGRHHR